MLHDCIPFMFELRTAYTYVYLRPCLPLPTLVPQGYSAFLLAYCLVTPKNRSLWWKLGGTAAASGMISIGLYGNVIISFMTFWPCRTSFCAALAAALDLVSCPAGKIGGKIRLVTLRIILTSRNAIRALIGVIEATQRRE